MPKAAVHEEVGDGLPPTKGVGCGVSKAEPFDEVDTILGAQRHRPQKKQAIDDDDVFGDRGQNIETARLELLTHRCGFTIILNRASEALHDFGDRDGEQDRPAFRAIIRVFAGKEFIYQLTHLTG